MYCVGYLLKYYKCHILCINIKMERVLEISQIDNKSVYIVVLVSNDNMHIDIKPYFCLAYRSILKYRGIRCFLGRDLPNSIARFSISQNVNKYGISGLAVSEI